MPNTREKLIELLCNTPAPEVVVFGQRCGKALVTAEFIADHLIANGVTVQKWISVKDRLPEDDDKVKFSDDGRMRFTTVLAYTEYGRTIPKNRLLVRPTGNEYLDTQVTDGWIWASGTEEVTHWMPLPQPPKGE